MLYSHLPDVVGVVGAGQMGTGIAQVLAQRGLQVGRLRWTPAARTAWRWSTSRCAGRQIAA